MADVGSKYDFCGMKKVRKSNFSPEEVDALVSTVGKNYHILYGEFAKRAVNKHARHRVWLDVTKQVNRVSLERRTLQEVKNKWKKCQHLYKERESLDDIVLPNVWEPLTALKDSMPLEQRLKAPPEQEPILQSQPLSPTKLKVTRQSTKLPQPSPKPPTPEPPNEEVCLRWNSHHSNMQTSFPSLLLREQYVDATLVAEGQSLKCHRLILSSCSPYFEEVLSGISPFQHPVLFMKDIPFWVLKSLCDFMYAGEVHIFQNKLEELLAVAETLKIKGLAGKTEGSNEEVKSGDTTKPVKEEKKEEKEVKEKKRNSQHSEAHPTPKTSSKAVKSVHPSKKSEKTSKEVLNKEGILDPLDLLEPVYEEVTKEAAPAKVKEVKSIPIKKGKLKKRKFSEEREESPPPMFLSRKGTRSRPNVKIPKYYHTHYERVSESTIVREPHTEQPDPLFQVEEIKSEPLDLDDDVIEIEDNVIGYTDVPEITSHDEEIMGNYDSPLVNPNDKQDKVEISPFNKINLVPQPIIMSIQSMAEKTPSTVQIIDVTQLKGTTEGLEKNEDPLETMSDVESVKITEDPLNFTGEALVKGTESITITNVQSVVEMEETEVKVPEDAGKEHQVEKIEEKMQSCEIRVEDIESEEETAGLEKLMETLDEVEDETNVPIHLDISLDDDKESGEITENVPNSAVIQEKITEGEVETENNHTAIITATEEDKVTLPEGDIITTTEEDKVTLPEGDIITTTEEDKVTLPEGDKEETMEDGGAESEGNEVELGFHIAKVASEQFSVMETSRNDAKDVISEDCASELGFQITNVVSGDIEDSNQVKPEDNAGGSDFSKFSNHLQETPENKDDSAEIKPASPSASNSLSEETQFLAESLEKLLDK